MKIQFFKSIRAISFILILSMVQNCQIHKNSGSSHSVVISKDIERQTRLYTTAVTPDIDYLGTGATEKMDIYYPSDADPAEHFPAILIIHGGGWTGGDKASSREKEIGNFFSGHGYVCASINYSLAGKSPAFPLNIMQCKSAVKYLRANAKKLRIDPGHIGVIGGSAGGHLALMTAFTGDDDYFKPVGYYPEISDKVQAVVDMYGITNLLTRQKPDENGIPKGVLYDGSSHLKYLGFSREQNPDLWKKASPVNYITTDDPPVLILHGLNDTTVDYKQSVELDSLLAKSNHPHSLVLIKNVGHTFSLMRDSEGNLLQEDLSPLVLKFFNNYLKPGKTGI